MKKPNIHPRLAGGLYLLAILVLFVFLEKISGYPFFSEHSMLIAIVSIPIVLFISDIYEKKYDADTNDNVKFVIVMFLELALLIVLIV